MTRRPDVAFFIPFLNTGGAEKVAINLTTEFADRGYSIDLVLVRAEGDLLEEVHPNVRIVDLGASRVAASLPGLIRYVNRRRPETLFSMMTHANLVALGATRFSSTDTRLVLSEHNMPRSDIGSLKERLMLHASGYTYSWADHVVAVSEGVKSELQELTGLPDTKLSVVYNPVVTPELREAATEPLDHPWFGPDEPPVIMSAGRHVPQKNFPTLLRAFARVWRERPARLVVLGEGPETPALRKLTADLGITDDIEFPGFVDNPFSYMSHASVFVLSSVWEGFGMVLPEAMACGCPVVSTDCPSGPAEILDQGTYGPLVSVGDDAAMADSILSIIEDPPDSELLLTRAKNFTVSNVVDSYEQILWPVED